MPATKIASGFVNVDEFFRQLIGNAPTPVAANGSNVSPTDFESFHTWLESSKEWNLAFKHIIELTDALSEDTLWMVLGIRAAGVLPHTKTGVDLVIPIFRGEETSFLLIRVDHRSKIMAGAFDQSPMFVAGDPLSKLPPCRMIRVCIGLDDSAGKLSQQVVINQSFGSSNGNNGYVLLLRGVLVWTRSGRRAKSFCLWSFLYSETAEQLNQISKVAWLDFVRQVQSEFTHSSVSLLDLDKRECHFDICHALRWHKSTSFDDALLCMRGTSK